jgi:hypothetical protein
MYSLLDHHVLLSFARDIRRAATHWPPEPKKTPGSALQAFNSLERVKMSDTSAYRNSSTLASENGHLTKGANWLARIIAESFVSPEPAGNDGNWTATCPLCGGRVLVLVHAATQTVGVACQGQGCGRDDVLKSAGFDPTLSMFYRP